MNILLQVMTIFTDQKGITYHAKPKAQLWKAQAILNDRKPWLLLQPVCLPTWYLPVQKQVLQSCSKSSGTVLCVPPQCCFEDKCQVKNWWNSCTFSQQWWRGRVKNIPNIPYRSQNIPKNFIQDGRQGYLIWDLINKLKIIEKSNIIKSDVSPSIHSKKTFQNSAFWLFFQIVSLLLN